MLLAVPELQVIGRDHDFHGDGLPRLHGHAFEAAEALGSVVILEFGVQLDHFLAVAGTSVLEVELDLIVVAVLLDFQVRILEGGVAEAEAEREDGRDAY